MPGTGHLQVEAKIPRESCTDATQNCTISVAIQTSFDVPANVVMNASRSPRYFARIRTRLGGPNKPAAFSLISMVRPMYIGGR